jgi:serine/threonine protein kinase
MGRVYLASHRQLKRRVAIKLLQHDIGGQDAVTRFLREARAAAQLSSVPLRK